MACVVNCKCKICGRVRLHVSKRVRQAKPKPADPAMVALAEATRALAGVLAVSELVAAMPSGPEG